MALNGWIAYDKKTNAVATATKTAVTGKSHVIYSITASLTTAVTAASVLVTLIDGVTTIWEGEITTGQSECFTFPSGISITDGAAVSATIAAGGASTIGTVAIHGKSI